MINTQLLRIFYDSESRKSSSSSISYEELLEGITNSKKSEQYNVVLLDDNDHTYEYVVEMLMDIFGYGRKESFEMTCEVDFRGRVIVFTGSKELAEQKSSEIMLYGADWRLKRSKGSMSSVVEPVN